jgi:hypothetical protein
MFEFSLSLSLSLLIIKRIAEIDKFLKSLSTSPKTNVVMTTKAGGVNQPTLIANKNTVKPNISKK